MQDELEHSPSERRILIIEDEAALAEIVRDYLIDASMQPSLLADGESAVETILSGRFDLVVLDLMLPVKDGLTICREVRQKSDVPIVMVTAKVEELDRLIGLELGADDYICKPFSPRELVARIKAIFRRVDKSAPKPDEPQERFIVDTERWLATLDGKSVGLTRREFRLLEILHARPGRVFSRSQLLDMAFPDDSDVIDRTIDSHVKNIRNKIKAVADWDPIRSVYGVGYAFDE